MCKCTPSIRTPYCGKGDCVWPEKPSTKPDSVLYRNKNPIGFGKYALMKIRSMRIDDIDSLLNNYSDVVDLGLKGTDSEFFVIRLKDKHAAPALRAYAESMAKENPQFAAEVLELAERAENHPNKKSPD